MFSQTVAAVRQFTWLLSTRELIPTEVLLSLQRCIQCNGNQPPDCETLFQDGDGVDNTDLIVNVSADESDLCEVVGRLSISASCQLEKELDRYHNYC